MERQILRKINVVRAGNALAMGEASGGTPPIEYFQADCDDNDHAQYLFDQHTSQAAAARSQMESR
jgi:hypothetical protein